MNGMNNQLANEQTINPSLIFFTLIKEHKAKIIVLIFLMMIIGLTPSINGILLKHIVDTADTYSGKALIPKMFFFAIAYVLWLEFINITYRFYDYFYMLTMPKLKGRVVDYFYSHIQHHSHAFFQSGLSGNISNRIMEATKSLEYFLSNVNEKIIKKAISIISALVTIYYVNSIFAGIFGLWLALFCIISLFFSPKINNLSRNLAGKKSEVAGRIVDAINNISAIRMFSTYRYERKYLSRYIDKFMKSDFDLQWFMLKIRYMLGLLCSLMTFAMIYYLTELRSVNLLTVGDFALILAIANDISNDIWDLSEEIGDTFEEYGSFKQSSLLLSPCSVKDIENAPMLHLTKGEIKFCNIVFKYEDQGVLFNDKSIVIPGKQKVGLVGYSGSGKSSFINLINRLYDVDSGEILIDDQNISMISQESLRNSISFIPQDPMLFHRTIIENIRYGQLDATDAEVIDAAKKAHIHEAIMMMPEQYNSLCGEKGGKLSGGQRQRIIIARAFLKNAPILILDEATSSLDSLTENLIQDSLKSLMQDKTVIVVAHKLTTLLSMDRILVFDNGRIIEDGAHDQLLKKRGLYYKFWHSQNEGVLTSNLVL
jgi:ABC-type multidrug transport system fused ATPase/permease subunit